MISNELIKIINEENIHLMHNELDTDVLGTFLSIDGLNIIIINEVIFENSLLYNTVLAEEIGHYFVSKGDLVPYDTNSLKVDLNYEKEENKALRWALNYFLPTKKVVYFILKSNQVNIHELSEYFGVTEDFIMQKFYFLSLNQDKIKLSSTKFLILSSYPTIYIYEDYERSLHERIS